MQVRLHILCLLAFAVGANAFNVVCGSAVPCSGPIVMRVFLPRMTHAVYNENDEIMTPGTLESFRAINERINEFLTTTEQITCWWPPIAVTSSLRSASIGNRNGPTKMSSIATTPNQTIAYNFQTTNALVDNMNHEFTDKYVVTVCGSNVPHPDNSASGDSNDIPDNAIVFAGTTRITLDSALAIVFVLVMIATMFFTYI